MYPSLLSILKNPINDIQVSTFLAYARKHTRIVVGLECLGDRLLRIKPCSSWLGFIRLLVAVRNVYEEIDSGTLRRLSCVYVRPSPATSAAVTTPSIATASSQVVMKTTFFFALSGRCSLERLFHRKRRL